MKRDMDLIRKILLEIEHKVDPYSWKEISIEDCSIEELNYHILLLKEAELIVAKEGSGVQRLTWAGHEFLDSLKNKNVWRINY